GHRRSVEEQVVAPSAGPGSGRRCVPQWRPAVRQQERSELEDHRGLGQGRDVDGWEEIAAQSIARLRDWASALWAPPGEGGPVQLPGQQEDVSAARPWLNQAPMQAQCTSWK